MYQKWIAVLMTVCLVATLFAGCGSKEDKEALSTNPHTGVTSAEEDRSSAGTTLPGQSQNADSTEQPNGSSESTANAQGGAEGTTQKTGGGSSSATTTKKASGGGSSSSTTKKPSGSGSSATTTTKPSGGGSSSTTTTKPSGGGSSTTTTTKPSGGGSQTNSKAEIVSYFNTAANKVKTGRPKLKASYSIYMNIAMEIPGEEAFEPTDETFHQTYSAGSNLDDAFPVFGKSWASQLQPSAVKSASRTLKDGKYTIRLVMNPENGVTNFENSAHGKAFSPFLSDDDFKNMMKNEGLAVKKITSSLHDSSITCVVDAKTGNMLSATYALKNNMSVRVQNLPISIPIQHNNTQTYQMVW